MGDDDESVGQGHAIAQMSVDELNRATSFGRPLKTIYIYVYLLLIIISETNSSLFDPSSLLETTNSKTIAGPKGTALAVEEAIYGSVDSKAINANGDDDGDISNVDYKMDFNDFVKVQQIDDVLVAALLRKPRSKLAKLYQVSIKLNGIIMLFNFHCF